MAKQAAKFERRASAIDSRSAKDEKIEKERARYAARMRNKRIFNYSIIVLILLAIGFATFIKFRTPQASEHDSLAKCLTKEGAVMYGTEWCSHCQEQKQMFGDSFQYINFVNCDVNPELCNAANVSGFPTWSFEDGPNAAGKQSLEYLAYRTKCD